MKAKKSVPSVFRQAERKRVASGLRDLANAMPVDRKPVSDRLRSQNERKADEMARAVAEDYRQNKSA